MRNNRVPYKYVLFLLASFLLFLGLRRLPFREGRNHDFASGPQRVASRNPEKPTAEASWKSGAPRGASVVKMELLIRTKAPWTPPANPQAAKNIFKSARPNVLPPVRKSEPLARKEENVADAAPKLPAIHIRLMGIILKKASSPQGEALRLAIFSDGEATIFAKKGDRVMDLYEIVDVAEESVEIKCVGFEGTQKLTLDK